MLGRIVTSTLRTRVTRQLIDTLCDVVAPRQEPWFDQPEAEHSIRALVERGDIDASDAELLQKWVTEGYVVVRNSVPVEDIDGISALVDGLASAKRPVLGLTFLGIRESPSSELGKMSHRDFLDRYSESERLRILSESAWRIHGVASLAPRHPSRISKPGTPSAGVPNLPASRHPNLEHHVWPRKRPGFAPGHGCFSHSPSELSDRVLGRL